MKRRYRLYRRKEGGRYYLHDDLTGKQTSLRKGIRSKVEARVGRASGPERVNLDSRLRRLRAFGFFSPTMQVRAKPSPLVPAVRVAYARASRPAIALRRSSTRKA